jgi:nucleolar protein 14
MAIDSLPRRGDEDAAMAPRAARGARSLKDAARSARGQASRFESGPVEPKRHSVLGQRKPRKPKSTVEHRKAADAERRETLLVEYRNQHRSNKVVDARFGEDDEALPADERYYARLQRERLRESRSSRFALEEPSTAMDLTHGGRSLGEMEEDELAGGYGGALGDDDLADTHPDGFGGSDFIKAVHFGGGGGGAALSQKEALDAAIAKHKLARLDRKEAKEKERGLVDRLDADFTALKQLIFSSAADAGAKGAARGGGREKGGRGRGNGGSVR